VANLVLSWLGALSTCWFPSQLHFSWQSRAADDFTTILVLVDISFMATVATNIIIILEGYFRGEEKGLALTN
jgi:hypothetical protein